MKVEIAVLARHLGVEYDLQKHVAQFVVHMVDVAVAHGLNVFVALLQQARQQALMGLLAVPGTAVGRAQALHHKRAVKLTPSFVERHPQHHAGRIEELAEFVKNNSLCGLGQTAPNPVLSTLKYFREEYLAHIQDKRCPAGVCKALLVYKIDPDKCRGCTLCARNCPADAIMGSVRNPHSIDTNKCVKCGACMDTCRFGAISKG